MILVANIEDIACALKDYAQAVSNPMGRLWLMTLPILHLLDLDDKQRDKNFVRLQSRYVRPETPAWKIACKCRAGKSIPANESLFPHRPFVLPDWAKTALQKQQPVYLFDLAATTVKPEPEVWEQVRRIRDWFNSNPQTADYTSLLFPEAAKNAMEWGADNNFSAKHDYVLKLDRPPE